MKRLPRSSLFPPMTAWIAAGLSAAAQVSAEPPLSRINLPPGFAIHLYAGQVENAREMALGEKGTLFVGTLQAGKVYAIRDHDGVADKPIVVASGLIAPNGVAYRDGALYVGDAYRILRFDDIEKRLENPPQPVTVYDGFPRDRHHGWKFIRFGPDGMLYVSVGAPCNVCAPPNPVYATITRMNADGTGVEIFARGVRNTVGFDWDPRTKELWFTDNGRDRLGDDLPPDELNHAPKKNMRFGFPYCHGRSISDPDFGSEHRCAEFTPPVVELEAHVAALGMRFYTGKMFPEGYRNEIFIAEHGSWDRSVPIGYRVVVARPQQEEGARSRVFAEGWLEGGRPWGRPVDVLVAPDGALLVSDDLAGAIYRITYGK